MTRGGVVFSAPEDIAVIINIACNHCLSFFMTNQLTSQSIDSLPTWGKNVHDYTILLKGDV